MEEKVVYFAKAGITDRVKIGCAANVLKRIQTLQTGCPDRLRVVLTFNPGSRYLETYFHKRFKSSRIGGEWFKYEPDISLFVENTHAERVAAIREAHYEAKLEREFYENMEREQEEHDRKMEEEHEKLMEQEAENAEEDC